MLRLRQIALVTDGITTVVDDLRRTFGLEVAYHDPGVKQFGLENAVLPVGSQFIEVVAPVRPDTAGGRYLERRNGEGGYMVITQCDDHGPVKARVDALGIRKVVEHDDGDYSIMQLHPRDTGGSFLEIDVQGGGEAMDGPWMPAGPAWQSAVRTDVVRGIAAAEIQSPAPAELAERWSAILDLPVKVGNKEHWTIRLDNATLRFVTATDGRGEGLGGVDLLVADGIETPGDDIVMVGGVRFRLIAEACKEL